MFEYLVTVSGILSRKFNLLFKLLQSYLNIPPETVQEIIAQISGLK
jgi:hypothetical protein